MNFERLVLLFIFLFIFFFSYAVFTTASEIREEVRELKQEQEERHLPTQCARYYADGTDRWKDCMGVGLV